MDITFLSHTSRTMGSSIRSGFQRLMGKKKTDTKVEILRALTPTQSNGKDFFVQEKEEKEKKKASKKHAKKKLKSKAKNGRHFMKVHPINIEEPKECIKDFDMSVFLASSFRRPRKQAW